MVSILNARGTSSCPLLNAEGGSMRSKPIIASCHSGAGRLHRPIVWTNRKTKCTLYCISQGVSQFQSPLAAQSTA